ncbi:rhodanese-like domain-containing protein [Paraburkholderia lycopersici]|uniref:3-mercaptopyruvate sulfurtransferase SseA, contains two rhodanese domains n=1 Tax=Paraburkholderia lycopersici TaxID=416944 RepID=A0A1G6TP82_9BURK|nr:rhodanese-like domain-containing protein [Paraburkholderia lycopersici]SDD30851.1 3-mercaptopyruvate sulfurtransferase SseA, contains two rhodanese domains [Paraburkholderia lycopersici]
MTLSANALPLVDARTVRAFLNDGREIALVDVREAGQFGEGHPFFAIPLPYSRLELDAPKLLPRREVRIVVLDDGASSVAARAGARLAQLGYRDVSILEGGARGWADAGYTLFRGVNVPSKTFGELVEHAYGTPHISAADLDRQRDAVVLLDGRTREEHRKMTIPGAVCCPNGELAAHIDTLAPSPGVPVVIHCAGRTRSIIGAQTLRSLGVANPVFALENGTQGWALAGLPLEHGSTRGHSGTATEAARERASALARRFGVRSLDAREAHAWIDDATRTTFLLDVRAPEEYAHDGLPHATHAPGGQLIQATDQTVGVRGARLLLVDYDGVRAPVVAHWLVQLGFEVATVAADIAASRPTRACAREKAAEVVARNAPPALDAEALRAAAAPAASPVVLDLRASAAWQQTRAAGSHWTTRAIVFDTLRAAEASPDTPLVLLADDPATAALVAADLRDAGYRHVARTARGLDTWREAGLPVDSSGPLLADSDRIDYLFFVHDRHDGNLDAARAYLAWETGLIAQCEPDELGVFRVGEPS